MTAHATTQETGTLRRIYEGDALRAVAMPIGGIGTGSIAIAGDGSLRQWQIHNQINHLACLPHSFFAIWGRPVLPSNQIVARVLQTDALHDSEPDAVPPTANDHLVPEPHRQLLQQIPGVEGVTFSGEYPIARLAYLDSDLPLEISSEIFSPFVPLDADDSGIPVMCVNVTITNPTEKPWRAAVAGTLQNAVGWDGVTPITGTRCQHYGGNTNHLVRTAAGTTITMGNAWLPQDAAGNGSMAISVDAPEVSWATQWDDLQSPWDDFANDGVLANSNDSMPSVSGRTWNGALAAKLLLEPGESRTIPFRIAWHFPNRYVNWDQSWYVPVKDPKTKYWVGNHYATRFSSALDVIEYTGVNDQRLGEATRSARDILWDTNLPPSLAESIINPVSTIRSPTCFRAEDGNFYGFEGCNGISTAHHAPVIGGSCPLNCTHVWNYEVALSRLFPDLERTMRATEWHVQQRPDGVLPHRVALPTYLPRREDGTVGAPHNPAIDGLLGAILKTYREFRVSGDREWLAGMWPGVRLALDHLWTTHDPERSGVIEGEQPNTYDISIYGANTFIGTLYLAALKAAARMADALDTDAEIASECLAIADCGREQIESRLWNGEYYIQDVDLEEHPEQNWASGCHIDHLFGQWWAWALDLGDLLDAERVRTATRSIFRNNFRTDFRDRNRNVREYVTDDDRGTLICTWPHGGRPDVPTLYSDEVWTGLEYELAAMLIETGQVDDALTVLDAVRERHDGTKQSPWNDIECGDHYVRAMSSWQLLEAATGVRHDAATGSFTITPRLQSGDLRAPFVTGRAWGTVTHEAAGVSISVRVGSLDLETLSLDRDCGGVTLDDELIDAKIDGTTIAFPSGFRVDEGQELRMH